MQELKNTSSSDSSQASGQRRILETYSTAHFREGPDMTHGQKDSISQRTVLLATDSSQSIIGEVVDGKVNSIAYNAYGQQSAQQEVATGLGFNGQLREMQTSWYVLGNGYRAYNPKLMRFHSPDSWSPFGRGGLNAYMYCVGDPINRSDPTGHAGGLWSLFTAIKKGGFGFDFGKSKPVRLTDRQLAMAMQMLDEGTARRSTDVKSPPSPSFLGDLGMYLDSLPKMRPSPPTGSLPQLSGHGVGGKWPIAMAIPKSSTRRSIDNLNPRDFTSAAGSAGAPPPSYQETANSRPYKLTHAMQQLYKPPTTPPPSYAQVTQQNRLDKIRKG
jgi:RHS repeat-associated protein